MITLDQVMARMSPARRKKIEARAAQLVAEEMTLRELRRARSLTQARIAKTLRISQDGVSRLERRTDLMLSTLRKSVEAMGGSLSLIVEFPDRAPVILSGIGEDCLPIDRRPSRRVPRPKPSIDQKMIDRKVG
jgi:transcriptional regulator with XRE-family HTH domain